MRVLRTGRARNAWRQDWEVQRKGAASQQRSSHALAGAPAACSFVPGRQGCAKRRHLRRLPSPEQGAGRAACQPWQAWRAPAQRPGPAGGCWRSCSACRKAPLRRQACRTQQQEPGPGRRPRRRWPQSRRLPPPAASRAGPACSTASPAEDRDNVVSCEVHEARRQDASEASRLRHAVVSSAGAMPHLVHALVLERKAEGTHADARRAGAARGLSLAGAHARPHRCQQLAAHASHVSFQLRPAGPLGGHRRVAVVALGGVEHRGVDAAAEHHIQLRRLLLRPQDTGNEELGALLRP